jgi:hypothetical protein
MENKNDLIVVPSIRNLWTMEGDFFFKIGAQEDSKLSLFSCQIIAEERIQKVGLVKNDGEKWIIRSSPRPSQKFEILEIDFKLKKVRVPKSQHNGWDGLESWSDFENVKEDQQYLMIYYPYNPCP